MASVRYCTPADVLALAKLDEIARLTADPGRPKPVAVADGIITVFDTPHYNASRITVYLNGVQAGVLTPGGTEGDILLKSGSGTDGADQLDFGAAPPLSGTVITAAGDDLAANLDVVRNAIDRATSFINLKLPAASLPVTSATALQQLLSVSVFLTMWNLRQNLHLNDYEPAMEEYREICRSLRDIGAGLVPLGIPEATPPTVPPRYSGEEKHYGAPTSTQSLAGSGVAS